MKFYESYLHERNYGCRVREYIYRGMRVLTMENECIKVSILADKGTDIYEFVYKPKDLDFMWHSFNGIRNPASFTATKAPSIGPFLDFYEGGWQELFPSVDQDCGYRGAQLGVHGEVTLLPWAYSIIKDTPEEIAVKFSVRMVRTPYLLEKTFRMKGEDPTLYLDETVVNEGRTEQQFMWGHHPAFGPLFLDESCVIEMPERCSAKTNWAELLKCQVLPRDTAFSWPHIKGLDGMDWDVSKVLPPTAGVYHSFYLYDLSEGRYSLFNTKRKIGFGMKWDKDMFPYIWVWAPYGAMEEYPWYGRNYTLAIEPWSAIPGNLEKVIENGNGIRIGPGEEVKTSIEAFAYEKG